MSANKCISRPRYRWKNILSLLIVHCFTHQKVRREREWKIWAEHIYPYRMRSCLLAKDSLTPNSSVSLGQANNDLTKNHYCFWKPPHLCFRRLLFSSLWNKDEIFILVSCTLRIISSFSRIITSLAARVSTASTDAVFHLMYISHLTKLKIEKRKPLCRSRFG